MIPQILQKFEISKNPLQQCKFSKNNHFCATYDDQGLIYIIDFTNNNTLYQLVGHHGSVTQLLFSEDSKYLLSIGEDKRLLKWVNFQHSYYEIVHHFPEVMTHFDVQSKCQNIILCGKSGKIYQLNVDEKFDYLGFQQIQNIQQEISFLVLTEDNQSVIIGTNEGACYIVDVKKQTVFNIDFFQQKIPINCLSLHPDQCVLAIGQSNNKIIFYDLRSKSVQFSFDTDLQRLQQINFSQDKKYFYQCSKNSSISVRDLQVGKNLQVLKISNQKLINFDLSNDSNYLISCTEEGNCILWQMNKDIQSEFAILPSTEKIKSRKEENVINSQKTQQKIDKIQENINRLLETVDLFNRVLQRNSDQLDQIEQHLFTDSKQYNQIKQISMLEIPYETVHGSSSRVLLKLISN